MNLNCLGFAFLGLLENFFDCSDCEADVLLVDARVHLATVISLILLVAVTLHSVGFAGSSLPVGEYSCVITFDDLTNQALDL